MSSLAEIRERRVHLLVRAASERDRLAAQLERWRGPLAFVDQGVEAASYIRRRPEWLVVAAIVFAVVRPRRALRIARQGFVAWRMWCWVSGTIAGVLGERPK